MRVIRSADAQARDHTADAIDVLREVMIDPLAEHKDRIKAAAELLDRGHGKAVNAVISVPLERRQGAQLAAMTDDDLMELIRSAPLPQLISHQPEAFRCGHPECPGDHDNELEICGEVVTGVDPLLL